MRSSPEAIAKQIPLIEEALKSVTSATETFKNVTTEHAGVTGFVASGKVGEAHGALVLSAMKLLNAIRGPVDSVSVHSENAAYSGAVRALLEMGVFDALPKDGSSMNATDLAEKLNVDQALLIRLMRCATFAGPFAETAPEEYAHTPHSLIYQVPAIRGVTKLMIDEFAPVQLQLAGYFKENAWQNPTSETNNPYTFAHRTNGKTIWEHLAQYSDRAQVFNNGMAAQVHATSWNITIYPFAEELSKITTNDETVLLVDIGGGKGHATKNIRSLTREIKGRVILQDLPRVIEDISEPLSGVEKMGYDFFTPQPIKGALIYYIRRCLHDWSDGECVKILKVIGAAMVPGVSRVLIAEMVVPASNVDSETCWMDLTMMAISGCERTKKQWEDILDAAGLKLSRIFGAPGTNHAVVEAFLK